MLKLAVLRGNILGTLRFSMVGKNFKLITKHADKRSYLMPLMIFTNHLFLRNPIIIRICSMFKVTV